MRRIKDALDPRGILNPGKKIPVRTVPSSTESAEPLATATH